MPFYDLPPDLRSAWSLYPHLSQQDLLRMRRHPLPGYFASPEVRLVLATWEVHTLADLVQLLPEEILSLPGATIDAFGWIAQCLSLVTVRCPSSDTLTADDFARLDTVPLREAGLSAGSTAALKMAGLKTLGDVARMAAVTRDALGLSLDEQRRCITAFRVISEPSLEQEDVGDQRPLPPNFGSQAFGSGSLGRSWLGPALQAEGLRTYADVMAFLADTPEDAHRRFGPKTRAGIEHLLDHDADQLRAEHADGPELYRLPYRSHHQPIVPMGADGHRERSILSRVRWTDADSAPTWAKALYRHGIDNFGLLAEADLAFLWIVADGDTDAMCAMIVALRRAWMDCTVAGSSVAVYGPHGVDPSGP
ncbi:hypothetical protein [Methylorubrum zatmanii]|uniref:Uncharacterized protein n=1 Tax=Methylorubrum zatmanii TaxID=29429 RepID=A0ABW1WSQ0_9HYPH|nr:hypothetical protein [Methylorubrum zatmanii]MBD8906037.1 hypothetical protein [Methylorubrum zatmanii]